MKLVDDWKQSPKWWSIQWQLALLVVAVITAILPLFEVHLSGMTYSVLMAASSIASVVFRLLSQTPPPTE